MEPMDRLEWLDKEIIAVHAKQRHLRNYEHELFAEKMEVIRELGNKAIANEAETRAVDQ